MSLEIAAYLEIEKRFFEAAGHCGKNEEEDKYVRLAGCSEKSRPNISQISNKSNFEALGSRMTLKALSPTALGTKSPPGVLPPLASELSDSSRSSISISSLSWEGTVEEYPSDS